MVVVSLCLFIHLFPVSLRLEIVDVQAFCSHVVWRIPSNLPCGYVSGYDIRLVNTVTNQEVVQRVDTSATFYSLGNDDSAKEPTSVQVYYNASACAKYAQSCT